MVVSARDVTERVELELLLTRSRRHAENAAQAKSEFLANMSHEIRTPMNGVLGFAELMMQSELDDQQQRHAELIVQSGRSMMLLLNDILDLSKIEAGQINIDSGPVDLHSLVGECADLHRASAEKKDITLTFESLDEKLWVQTDGLRLRQIILNLVGNAVKFTEEGEITVSYAAQADQFSVCVKDTGIGISAERLGRIFDPFEQGENDTSRRFGGTGLGLSISRQLAELLGGFLDVDSSPGLGTRFTLTLPLIEAAHGAFREDEPKISEPETLPQSSRILLAEDHDVNRLLVTSMLERCGQHVSIAHDGNEAVAMVLESYLREEPYDLVLMDVQMPGCDGYAATRAIRTEGIRGDVLPIIALTANAFPEDIAAAKDSGMQAHLSKPLSFSQLVGALQRWLPIKIVEEEGRLFTESRTEADPEGNVHEFDAKAGKASHSPALIERWQERRREALQAVDTAVRQGRLTGCEGDDLARLVHKLAGTAGMFGEEELGDRAAAFERALRSEVDAEIRAKLAMDLLEAA
ncbi:MAG: ATP-binding protein [Erythrobacter sp.]